MKDTSVRGFSVGFLGSTPKRPGRVRAWLLRWLPFRWKAERWESIDEAVAMDMEKSAEVKMKIVPLRVPVSDSYMMALRSSLALDRVLTEADRKVIARFGRDFDIKRSVDTP